MGSRWIAAAAVLATALVGCGGDGDDPQAGFEPSTTSESGGGQPSQASDVPSEGSLLVGFTPAGDVEHPGRPVVAALSPDGNDLRAVVPRDDEWSPWWVSPDGERLVVDEGWRDGVTIVDLAMAEPIWSGLEGHSVDRAAWSHQSDRFAVSLETEPEGDLHQQLAVVPRDGGDLRMITDPAEWYDDTVLLAPPPAWSADGDLLAFGLPVHLFYSDTGVETDLEALTGDNAVYILQWSPDGAHALVATEGEIAVARVDGSRRVQLAGGLPLEWSPAGDRILTMRVIDDHVTLLATPIDGSTETVVWTAEGTYGSIEDLPHIDTAWSPSGDEVALVGGSAIWIVDLASGEETDVVVLDPEQGRFSAPIEWVAGLVGGIPITLADYEELGTPGTVEAVDLRSGGVLWTTGIDGNPVLEPGSLGVPISTGASGVTLTMVGRENFPQRDVVAIDNRTGELLWSARANRASDLDAGADPVLVLVDSLTSALDATTGTAAWQAASITWYLAADETTMVGAEFHPATVQVTDRLNGDERARSTVCEECHVSAMGHAAGAVAVATTDPSDDTTTVTLLDASTLDTRWAVEIGRGSFGQQLTMDDRLVVAITPLPSDDSGDHHAMLTALKIDTGSIAWQRETLLDPTSLLALADDVVVVVDIEATLGLDRADGSIAWNRPGGYGLEVADDVAVIVAHGDGTADTRLWAYDASTGDGLWGRAVPGGPRDIAVGDGLVAYGLPADSGTARPLDVPTSQPPDTTGPEPSAPDTLAPAPPSEESCAIAEIESGLPYPGLAQSEMIVRIRCVDRWATVLAQPPTDAPGFVLLLLRRSDGNWVHDRTCGNDTSAVTACLADLPPDVVADLALVAETYSVAEHGGEPESWAAECSSPPLRRGDSGLCVARLQTLLVGTFGAPIAIDGHFGPATETSLLTLQSAWGLEVDGYAGPATWAALTDAST